MENSTARNHWETVYESKTPDQVSWTQKVPKTSLDLIASFGLDRDAHIIDVGGGDSSLVDFLIEEGYSNITVLDISAIALEKAKKRLGEKGQKIKWVVSDINDFEPDSKVDVWHDRALFHFLTVNEQIEKYIDTVQKCVKGQLIIGTFSENGPTKCSGLNIQQYSEETLVDTFNDGFEKISCHLEDHSTPFGTIQNFLFCSFQKKDNDK